jgi:hypothetical protein
VCPLRRPVCPSRLGVDRVGFGWLNGMWRSLVSAPALGAGGPRFESGHPDHQRRSSASSRSASGLSRSSDRGLTVDLNTGRRYWLTLNGTHQPAGMVCSMARLEQVGVHGCPNDAGKGSNGEFAARWAHNPEVVGSNPAPATRSEAPSGSGRGLLHAVCARICARDQLHGAWPGVLSAEKSRPPMISSARVFATCRSASRSVWTYCFMVKATSA